MDAKRLTEQARKARRLAASMVDQKAAATLLGLATEYEAQLAKLVAEAEQNPEGGSLLLPPPAAPTSPLVQPTPPMEPAKD